MLRNLLSTLRHFATASILNIMGLGVAFAAFILIIIQVSWEYGYGTSDRDADRTFCLEQYSPLDDEYSGNIFFPLSNAFASFSPEIESYAQILHSSTDIDVVRPDGERSQLKGEHATYLFTDPCAVFDFEMLAGTMASALEPNSVVISSGQAARFFGEGADPMGQRIVLRDRDFTVTGVYRDLPQNATIRNSIMFRGYDRGVKTLYVKLRDAERADDVVAHFATLKEEIEMGFVPAYERMRLTAVGDAYFAEKVSVNSFIPHGNLFTTNLLLLIAVLVVVIAAVNFVNFSTALAPVRMRGLNSRLVFGETVGALRRSLIFEAVGISLIAYLLGLFLAYEFSGSHWASMLRVEDATLTANMSVVWICAAVALVVGVVAGIYPAYYNTRFEPALVLKGNFAMSSGGSKLRMALLGFQYVVSIGLIISAIFMSEQHKFMLKAPLGYDRDNLINISIGGSTDAAKMRATKEMVGQIADVQGVTDYNGAFGISDCDLMGEVIAADGDTIRLDTYYVGTNFITVMGMPLIEGDNFAPTAEGFMQPPAGHVEDLLINRAAAERLGVSVGDLIGGGSYRVLGITENYVSRSVASPLEPVALALGPYNSMLLVRVKPDADVQAMGEAITKAIAEFVPGSRPSFELFDAQLTALYAREQDMGSLVGIFSLLAILIALVGVFGLVMFETQFRRHEIAVRKIHGATVAEVVNMFNARFVCVVVICFVVSVPLACWGVSHWMSDFALRIEFEWWIPMVALALVLGITLLTVTMQSWRAAVVNPVAALKS